MCRDAVAADDLAQEALLKAWKAREAFAPGTNMKAWTFTILRNHFYTEKRRNWRESEWDEEAAERSLKAHGDQMAVLELDDLRRALSRLPDAQRDALILVGAGGFAYDEAAEICGCAIGTIKSRVNRARIALESVLDSGALPPRSKEAIAADAALEALIGEADAMSRSPS